MKKGQNFNLKTANWSYWKKTAKIVNFQCLLEHGEDVIDSALRNRNGVTEKGQIVNLKTAKWSYWLKRPKMSIFNVCKNTAKMWSTQHSEIEMKPLTATYSWADHYLELLQSVCGGLSQAHRPEPRHNTLQSSLCQKAIRIWWLSSDCGDSRSPPCHQTMVAKLPHSTISDMQNRLPSREKR